MSNTSRKLSSDEVSALMEGLQSGEISANSGLNNDVEVTDFTFGSDNLELLGDYYALRLINERFARLVRSIFLPMIRLQPKFKKAFSFLASDLFLAPLPCKSSFLMGSLTGSSIFLDFLFSNFLTRKLVYY